MPYKQKGSPYYYISYTDAGGRRVKTSAQTASYADAKALEEKRRTEARLEKQWGVMPEIGVQVVLGYFLDATKATKRSHETDAIRAVTLVQALASEHVNRLNGARIQAYVAARRQVGVRDSTINRELALLSAAINRYNQDHGARLPNPVTGRRLREPEGRTRYLTEAQAGQLLDEAARSSALGLADFIRLALFTGMRSGEILGLEWSRVDLAAGTIRLQGRHTKSGKGRVIPIVEGARGALIARRNAGGGGPWVFARADGLPVRSLRRPFKAACKRCGIEDFRPHDLRHTCASWLAQAGVSLAAIREILGHASIQMTERYSHLSHSDIDAAMRALNARLPKNSLSVILDCVKKAG